MGVESPGTLCTCLPRESARQVFWEPEPHPVYQSINASQPPRRYFHIGNPAPVDVQLSPGMPAAALGTGDWSGLHWNSWDGSICSLQQLGGGWESLSDGFWLLFVQKDAPPPQGFTQSMTGSTAGPADNH